MQWLARVLLWAVSFVVLSISVIVGDAHARPDRTYDVATHATQSQPAPRSRALSGSEVAALPLRVA